jgi:3-oxoadipate enol-lactonase
MPTLERELDFYYIDQGEGDAILFCHGAGGNAASWWQQVPEFSRDYRCVAYDCRGFGRSTCTAEQFDLRKFGDDAVALMDALDIERADFVCQSMGGWTGVQVALSHPDRIGKLVLSDTIGGIALESGVISAQTVEQRVADTRISRIAVAPDYHEKDPAMTLLYIQISDFNRVPVDIGSALFAEDVLVPLDAARGLTLPILIFSGVDDVIWPPEILKELCGHLQNARLIEIDSGHSPYFEKPEVFNTALRDFLEND